MNEEKKKSKYIKVFDYNKDIKFYDVRVLEDDMLDRGVSIVRMSNEYVKDMGADAAEKFANARLRELIRLRHFRVENVEELIAQPWEWNDNDKKD